MISNFDLSRALSLKLRIAIVGGGIAAVAAGYGVWHHKVFNSGWNAAIAAIAAQDSRPASLNPFTPTSPLPFLCHVPSPLCLRELPP